MVLTPSITLNSYREESHDWNHFIPEGATKLLIGTFPTEVGNRRHDFFYSSATNRFWNTIGVLSNTNIQILNGANGISEKKEVLKKLKLGLTDIGKKVYRQIGSSNDHSLFPIEFMDIIQLTRDYPLICTLIVSGESKGSSSLSWFSIFCNLNNIQIDLTKLKKLGSTDILMAGRKLKVCKAYSPSRAARRVTDDLLLENYTSIIQSPD